MHPTEYHYQTGKQVSPACSRRNRVVRQISRYRFLASLQILAKACMRPTGPFSCTSLFHQAVVSARPIEKSTEKSGEMISFTSKQRKLGSCFKSVIRSTLLVTNRPFTASGKFLSSCQQRWPTRKTCFFQLWRLLLLKWW